MISEGLVSLLIFVFHVHSQIIGGLTVRYFLTNSADSSNVFGQIDYVPWDNTRYVIPLMLFVGEDIVLEAVSDVLLLNFLKKLFLLLPFVHLHICYFYLIDYILNIKQYNLFVFQTMLLQNS